MFEESIEAASIHAQTNVAALEQCLPRDLSLAGWPWRTSGLASRLIIAGRAPLSAAGSSG
jgi:hypothetical protein